MECCAGSGIATLDVFLDKEGFAIGEPIKIKVIVINKSDRDIKYITTELKKVSKNFITFNSYAHEFKNLTKVSD